MIFLRVFEPLSGAKRIPAIAPMAIPANVPNTIFPVLIIDFYLV
jgi:hypothetical protein